MAYHQMTFLRSAMARDPFCHGGLITPEDVLRLEAKCPTLFDKPALPPPPTSIDFVESKGDSESDDDEEDVGKTGNDNSGNKLERKSKVTNLVNGRKLKVVPPPVNNARSTHAKPGIQTKKKANTFVARPAPPRPRPTNTQTQGQKKMLSEFHKKCIEKREETAASGLGQLKKEEHSTPKGKAGGGGGSKLVRPAQSFSLEDLRATLRQVMREEALQFNQGWKIDKSQPSPYTEDLVKKFLGWKMQIGRGAGAGTIGRRQRMNTNQIDQWKGQGDVIRQGSRMNTGIISNDAPDHPHFKSTLNRDGEGERKKLSMHTTAAASSPMQKERAIPRIRSAPGFLRGISELPPVPNYQKKRMMLSMARESGGSFHKLGQDESQEIGGGGDGGESRRKHVTWEESVNDEEIEEENDVEKRAQSCEELSRKHAVKHVAKRPGMRGTTIHLRSHKKDVLEYGDGDASTNDERFKVKSSYHQLLAARTEKNRYELKGLLRKQDIPCNFYTNQVNREREERRNVRERDGRGYYMEKESSSDPSENFKRKVKQMGKRSKEETNKVLEKIAQELVYMEVLHQIDELKREQVQDDKKIPVEKQTDADVSSSTVPSPRNLNKLLEAILPDFKATTTDADGESESTPQNKGKKVSEEIILKTPELTPPIKNNRLIVAARNAKTSPLKLKGNESSTEISLHTPKLSPSPNKRLIAAIKERKDLQEKKKATSPQTQQHMDTDCSEMSDFVFSEASKREENQGDIKRQQKSEESVKLKTPELSNSHQQKVILPENTTEKDKSTMSGVPSEFLKTESVEDQEDKLPDESEKDNTHSAKYSDDFIPEGEVSSVSDRNSTAVVAAKNMEPPPKHLPVVRSDADDVEESEEADNEDDNVENLNMSGETVIDLLSEGEFIGEAYRSPGEVSLRGGSHGGTGNRSSVASSSQTNRHTSGGTSVHENEQRLMKFMSSIASSSTEVEDENSSISVLSFGAQVGSGNGERPNIVSFGEYIKRLEF